MTSTLRYPSREVRDLAIASPMERGLSESFDRLAQTLAERLAELPRNADKKLTRS